MACTCEYSQRAEGEFVEIQLGVDAMSQAFCSQVPNMPAGGFLAILCVLLYMLVEIVSLWARNLGLSSEPSIAKS